ncbi:MAG TPA: hypothetical protein VJC39_05370 [Candidatus Nanoarchaeia archaeon]|nr:hypothetical protein [Candidatus Nanoarchaeia archaeon]
MVVLRSRVNCSKCKSSVDKNETILISSKNYDRTYECYSCYKKSGLKQSGIRIRQKCYCERCRYKFNSLTLVCPYCSKDDQVIAADISISNWL